MSKLITSTKFARTWLLIAAIAVAGCGDKGGKKDAEKKKGTAKAGATVKQPTDNGKKKKDPRTVIKHPVTPPPPIARVPPVVMSKHHRDMLSVFQNDALPEQILDAQLVGLDGKTHTLQSELGDKLTILLFWSSDHAYAAEELQYLATTIAPQFGDKGVKIVTVNQRDNQQQARQAAGDAGASSLVTLLDPDKTLSKLANGSVPRTYLLDSEGRVLWLDIVFDRTTKRHLNGAIEFVLKES